MKNKQQLVILAVAVVLLGILGGAWAMTRSPKSAQTPQSVTTPTGSSLYIKEWTVKLPLTPTIADAYYVYDASNSEVLVSTQQLDTLLSHVQGCTSGLHALYYKRISTSPLTLAEQRRAEPLCAVSTDSNTEQIGIIQAGIRTAAQAATAK